MMECTASLEDIGVDVWSTFRAGVVSKPVERNEERAFAGADCTVSFC